MAGANMAIIAVGIAFGCAQPVPQQPAGGSTTTTTTVQTNAGGSNANQNSILPKNAKDLFALLDYAHVASKVWTFSGLGTATTSPVEVVTDKNDPDFWAKFLAPLSTGPIGIAQVIAAFSDVDNSANHHPNRYQCALWKAINAGGEQDQGGEPGSSPWTIANPEGCPASSSGVQDPLAGNAHQSLSFDLEALPSDPVNAYMLLTAAKKIYLDKDKDQQGNSIPNEFEDTVRDEWRFTQNGAVFILDSGTRCRVLAKPQFPLVVCMGTTTEAQWQNNFLVPLVENKLGLSTAAKVHQGFSESTALLAPKIEEFIQSFATDNGQTVFGAGDRIWFTGHSRGAALATLLAAKFAKAGRKVGLAAFAGPRTMNAAAAKEVTAAIGTAYIANFLGGTDMITHLMPTKLSAENETVAAAIDLLMKTLATGGR